MRIDSSAPVPQDLIRAMSASVAQPVASGADFAGMVAAQPPAEQSRAYSFLELGWAGHAGAQGPATPSDLLAQSSSARSRTWGAGRQADPHPTTAPRPPSQSGAVTTGATPSVRPAEDKFIAIAATPPSPRSIQLSDTEPSPPALRPGAPADFTSSGVGAFADLADAEAETFSDVVVHADPVTVSGTAAPRNQTLRSAPSTEMDGISEPIATDASGEQLDQAPATQTNSGEDISVVVSQQGGTTQVIAGAPELAPVAAAQLRKAVEGVAAELGVTISEFFVNGASLGEASISLIGVWNGRHPG